MWDVLGKFRPASDHVESKGWALGYRDRVLILYDYMPVETCCKQRCINDDDSQGTVVSSTICEAYEAAACLLLVTQN